MTALMKPDDQREALLASLQDLRAEVGKAVVGQRHVLDELLMALVVGGHALLVGAPGLAKTLLIRSLAQAMSLDFRRIQFTPDLAPGDVTGAEILDQDRDGRRAFRFVQGPVFANIVLADEINRAPPRTQAALLEAMQERSVTAAGRAMPLPTPFFVLATQNPIEQEGVYPLPEAQLDRFLFDIRVGYPTEEEEIGVLRATTSTREAAIRPVLDGAQALALQRLAREIPASEAALRYATALVRATRPEDSPVSLARQYVRWGAGPRAGQALILGAKAHALLNGRSAVAPEDIRRVAHPALRHRVLLNFAAEAERLSVERVIDALLAETPEPASSVPA